MTNIKMEIKRPSDAGLEHAFTIVAYTSLNENNESVDIENVEASPYDRIWGIGLGEEQARITPPEQWLGTNWLGEVLTKLRDDLKSA
jgi:hypothetical protein